MRLLNDPERKRPVLYPALECERVNQRRLVKLEPAVQRLHCPGEVHGHVVNVVEKRCERVLGVDCNYLREANQARIRTQCMQRERNVYDAHCGGVTAAAAAAAAAAAINRK